MEKCCPIVSYLDEPSKLRNLIKGDLPSYNTTHNQPKKNSCKSVYSDNFSVYLWQGVRITPRLWYGLIRNIDRHLFSMI